MKFMTSNFDYNLYVINFQTLYPTMVSWVASGVFSVEQYAVSDVENGVLEGGQRTGQQKSQVCCRQP